MNAEINIECDRCGTIIHGIVIEEEGFPKVTGGFYDVLAPSVWGEFALTNEEQNVCDSCMWADQRFLEKYPLNRKTPLSETPTTAQTLPSELVESIRDAGIAKRAITP